MLCHLFPKFVGRRHCGGGDIKNLVFHLILQQRLLKDNLTLWVGAPQAKSPAC